MALVKYGGGILDMRGSIGGNTYARNRYGAYARARVVPVNPNTTRQQGIRAAMSALVQRWNTTLTQPQRDGWDNYAANVDWKNKLGETQKLTGFSHYIRSGIAMDTASLGIQDEPPSILSLPDGDPDFTVTADEASGEISVAFDDALAWLNETGSGMSIFSGQPVKTTVNYFTGPWRHGTTLLGDDTTPLTTPQVFTPNFPVVEGQKIFCYGRILLATGRVSNPFRSSCTVAAGV